MVIEEALENAGIGVDQVGPPSKIQRFKHA
jgi:hypothetical protein